MTEQLITMIADGLEEINISGVGYGAEAAEMLINYLSERGYEFFDVLPEKAAKRR